MISEADYVRKSIFNIHMQRIDQRFEALEKSMDKTVERLEAIAETHLAKLDLIASEMRGDIKAINARLDTLENRYSWNLAWVGIIMALALAIFQHLWK